MPEQDGRTILLRRGRAANRALVAAILSRADGRLGQVEMVEADTMQSARDVLASRVVDLVLLDVRLPDGSGLDLVDEIAALPAERRPRIVIMSASVLPNEREAALRSGADSFLGKPCRPSELIETIAGFFAGRPTGLGAASLSGR